MQNHVINIIIADDHVLFIEGLKLLFATEDDIRILDVANGGKELLGILGLQQPDIILLDINMPKLNGLDTIKYIKKSYPQIKVIVLSTYNEEHLIEKAKTYGANGYQLKNSNKQDLLQTIRLVHGGQFIFPYRISQHADDFGEKDNFLKQFNLTKRELEIIGFIKQDYTNQQIADKLYLSIYTVETHRKNIMQKLGISKPAALIKFIVEHNL